MTSEITDEMVEVACQAHNFRWDTWFEPYRTEAREDMRKALEAALAARPIEKTSDEIAEKLHILARVGAGSKEHSQTLEDAALHIKTLTARLVEAGSVVDNLRGYADRRDGNIARDLRKAADLIQAQAAAIAERDERIEQERLSAQTMGDQLGAETDRLTRERDERIERLSELNAGLCNDFNSLLVRNSRLQDRAERMEKALREIAEQQSRFLDPLWCRIQEVARAALQQEGENY